MKACIHLQRDPWPIYIVMLFGRNATALFVLLLYLVSWLREFHVLRNHMSYINHVVVILATRSPVGVDN